MDEVSSHVCLVLPSTDGKAARKLVPPRLRIPYWKGLGADSEEKHEPAGDIDTAAVDSLKALDPNRPIREADIPPYSYDVCYRGQRRHLRTDKEKRIGFCTNLISRGKVRLGVLRDAV